MRRLKDILWKHFTQPQGVQQGISYRVISTSICSSTHSSQVSSLWAEWYQDKNMDGGSGWCPKGYRLVMLRCLHFPQLPCCNSCSWIHSQSQNTGQGKPWLRAGKGWGSCPIFISRRIYFQHNKILPLPWECQHCRSLLPPRYCAVAVVWTPACSWSLPSICLFSFGSPVLHPAVVEPSPEEMESLAES